MGAQRRVVAGVDGSALSLQAVRWAAREAAERRMPLRLVAATGDPLSSRPATGLTSFRDVVIETARRHLTVATDTARYIADGLDVTAKLRTGHPIAVLAEESEDAALVALGHRGLGGVTGLLAGSVAVGVTARASCPVVVTRGRTRQPDAHPVGPVVAGVDGSDVSEAALAFAFDTASRRHARLFAVHSWLDRVVELSKAAPLMGWEAMLVEERKLLAQRLAGWSEKYPDVMVHRIVPRDRPARALVDHSVNAQLLVVGSHGRGALSGAILGSVSQAVLHRAECPVAVVRPEGVAR